MEIKNIYGFRRDQGDLGIRNYIVIMPSVICANEVAKRISYQVENSIVLPHTGGCGTYGGDIEKTFQTLVGLGQNPNVAALLIVGLGCETVNANDLVLGILKESPGKIIEKVIIQEEKGTSNAITRGVLIASEMARKVSTFKRSEGSIEDITFALECGGSDPTSGLAANPVLGYVTEKIISLGGRVILSETRELIGAEHILAKNAINKEVAKKLLEVVYNIENKCNTWIAGTNQRLMSAGNIRGGLTTIEEKALGCINKVGNAKVSEVVQYAQKPREKGLIVMDTTGHDIPSMTGMVAGGAQLVGFTTGKGNTVGYALAPVIKITGNPDTFMNMRENIDIDASTIITGKESIEEVGERLFNEIIEVCNGKLTKAESFGFKDFALSTMAGAF
ncbi:MAG: UxaA family hydrolase [Candidatus Caldatribacteriota bacterium]